MTRLIKYRFDNENLLSCDLGVSSRVWREGINL